MAFIYETREAASDELERSDAPKSTWVERDHETGLWGWKEAEAQQSEAPAVPEVDPADVEAKEGDVVLQIGGPMLLLAAQLEAAKWAKKGYTIILRDATTGVEVERVKRGTKAASSGGGPRHNGPTDLQQIMIDLASREIGATGADLKAAGAEGAAKPGTVSFSYQVKQIMKASGKWGAPLICEIREVSVNRFKTETRYFLIPAERAEYDEALAELLAMEAEVASANKAKKAANGNDAAQFAAAAD